MKPSRRITQVNEFLTPDRRQSRGTSLWRARERIDFLEKSL